MPYSLFFVPLLILALCALHHLGFLLFDFFFKVSVDHISTGECRVIDDAEVSTQLLQSKEIVAKKKTATTIYGVLYRQEESTEHDKKFQLI